MGRNLALLIFSLSVGAIYMATAEEQGRDRDGKVLSLFQIVRFPNDPCIGSASKNGTCYTAEECSSRGGTNAGSCASGYGICCTFTAGCGTTSSENCTYFESTGAEIGGCRLEICRCSHNVCQLRLDFNQFQITGPSTSTVTVTKEIFGVGNPASGLSATTASQCLTDTFSVSNPSGQAPPTICGQNTGEHMYVDSSDACNDLTFTLGQQGIGAGVSTRQWSIKITQYSCDFPNLAPDGCTQYFFGASSQTVQTYNFDGGQHLANQDQNICVRRERGNCRICWTTQQAIDFAVSGKTATPGGFVLGAASKFCCGYGTDGLGTLADCAFIPGALAGSMSARKGMGFCGRDLGLGTTMSSGAPKTVCSDRTPFSLRFLSDSFELDAATNMEIAKANAGFKLTYIQNANCLNP